MDARSYDVVVSWDDDAEMFIADVPDLPGCGTQGNDMEEVQSNAREAIALYLESLAAEGKSVPESSKHQMMSVAVDLPA